MMKKCLLLLSVLLLLVVPFSAVLAAGDGDWLPAAGTALDEALKAIGANPADQRLLLLTNAGYGLIGEQSTEAFLDLAQTKTGCSLGRRSLVAVHTSVDEALWFSLYRPDNGRMVMAGWKDGGFGRQIIEAAPENILTPEGWSQAAKGPFGARLFSCVSLSLSWKENPPWPLMTAAAFHDHFCPGVNSGFIAANMLRRKLPLGPGDAYVFVTAPGKCAADALQVVFNTTAGKSGGYTMDIAPSKASGYGSDGVPPFTVAMRVNKKADRCDVMVLGFDWAAAYRDTGVTAEEHSPKGGNTNPLFWISRVKMSARMAAMPLEKQMSYIKILKTFSGQASLVSELTAGDPYAAAWRH